MTKTPESITDKEAVDALISQSEAARHAPGGVLSYLDVAKGLLEHGKITDPVEHKRLEEQIEHLQFIAGSGINKAIIDVTYDGDFRAPDSAFDHPRQQSKK